MDFFFYLGRRTKDQENVMEQIASSVWDDIETVQCPDLFLIYPISDLKRFLVNDGEFVGCIDGWVANVNERGDERSIRSFYKAVAKRWPLDSDHFSGCFSGLCFEKNDSTLRIFSDEAAVYPIYYCSKKDAFVGRTSQVIIGKFLNSDIDWVGVIEMISPPNYITLGTRTILADVKQLLPGELIEVSRVNIIRRYFDNTLFGEPNFEPIKDQARFLWEVIKADTKACVDGVDSVNLGMSGGWDSRLTAAALQEFDNQLNFYTYGVDPREYEARIAERCANLLHANYTFCNIYETYFPEYFQLFDNVKRTESCFVTQWFAILDSHAEQDKEIFMLGDMHEAIIGRNIQSLTSRISRKRRFLHPLINNELLVNATSDNFTLWSSQIKSALMKYFTTQTDKNSDLLVAELGSNKVLESVAEDIDSLLKRIECHQIPYTILFDELFAWFTHGKSMSRQFLCLKGKFTPLAPTMSSRLLRLESKIDPIARANGILLQEIQKIPEIRRLSSLPSAAIPFIPSSFPLWMKDVVWAGRSTIDQKLTRRAMKRGNKNARFRLLSSVNLVSLYNHPHARERVAEYFEGSPISGNQYLKKVESRASLASWPLINADIIAPANAAILIKILS